MKVKNMPTKFLLSILTLGIAGIVLSPTKAQALTTWTESPISFTHPDNDTNGIQDVITPNVILDRGTNQPIFNAAVETSYTSNSPSGTLWARGSISDGIGTLNFGSFRSNVCLGDCGGAGQLGSATVETVMYSTADDLYVDIIWDDWTQGGGGGFAYRRSTSSAVPVPFEVDATLGLLLVGGISSIGYFRCNNQKKRISKL